jgi:uncharacterized protein (DUF2062 family)
MPRKLLKRWLPDHRTFREHKHLKRFGSRLQDPNLWHINRKSVPGAVSAGLFAAFIPTPFQMVIAAALAILFRVNLPIAAALVWITNPITMPPVFFFCYRIGAWLLDRPVHRIDFSDPSITWLLTEMKAIWAPFLLGCMITAVGAAILGNLFVRAFWRIHVNMSWRARRQKQSRQQEVGQKSAKMRPGDDPG